jgi:hypothetical protein
MNINYKNVGFIILIITIACVLSTMNELNIQGKNGQDKKLRIEILKLQIIWGAILIIVFYYMLFVNF